jgi:hypothetical protein
MRYSPHYDGDANNWKHIKGADCTVNSEQLIDGPETTRDMKPGED